MSVYKYSDEMHEYYSSANYSEHNASSVHEFSFV